ncbi:MAG: hypothetical protein DID92_2727743055 [Candidatus Nitrotoga sp. SPKER]|nr:MAG: hypothetical protein DID92_2727743055 [Candidatus Nitrotoga sp. SPKER]
MVGVLGQTAIASLGEAPQALQSEERVFDLGAHRRLASIRCLVRLGQRTVRVVAYAGEIFRLRRKGLELLALLLASIRAVVVETGFVAMQQIRYFVAGMHIYRRDAGAVDQTAFAVDTSYIFMTTRHCLPFWSGASLGREPSPGS